MTSLKRQIIQIYTKAVYYRVDIRLNSLVIIYESYRLRFMHLRLGSDKTRHTLHSSISF
jgi:hypothetical protein